MDCFNTPKQYLYEDIAMVCLAYGYLGYEWMT